jgi:hypothetical protein
MDPSRRYPANKLLRLLLVHLPSVLQELLDERDYKSPDDEIWSVSSNTSTTAFFSRRQMTEQLAAFIAPLLPASHLHIYAS